MALEAGDFTLLHQDHTYRIAGEPPRWTVSRGERLLGYLVTKSTAGEEGEDVYEMETPDGERGNVEGTDWESIVRAYLNSVDPVTIDPVEP
ncbi:hypothetical protein ACFJGV_06565 [Cnuibacter sp. UC19_7]|uniref:hypothetical protein n=1 Tax=Cnuibacter sp. UC19_7 TaxID=3350166 RepID=UPI0036717228